MARTQGSLVLDDDAPDDHVRDRLLLRREQGEQEAQPANHHVNVVGEVAPDAQTDSQRLQGVFFDELRACHLATDGHSGGTSEVTDVVDAPGQRDEAEQEANDGVTGGGSED